MDREKLHSILTTLGEQVPPASRVYLIGGSALTLLGSPRQSLDVDFVGDDIHPSELLRTIMGKARKMKLQVDIVPLDRFIPLPDGNEQRSIHIGQFGNLEVNVIDPYSIALSKLDRGLFTDFDDIIFLIKTTTLLLKSFCRSQKMPCRKQANLTFIPIYLSICKNYNPG